MATRHLLTEIPEDRIEYELLGAERYQLEPPRLVQYGADGQAHDEELKTSPISIVELVGARLFFDGARCRVLSRNGEYVHGYGVEEASAQEFDWRQFKRLKGTSLLLADSSGAHCYYHWMVDVLPKVGLLQRAGWALNNIDHFLIREITASFQRETLVRAGVPLERVVETRKRPGRICDRLLIVRLNNGINMRMNRFIPLWLKHLFPPVHPLNERIRLYITRPVGVRRAVRNEADLLPLFRKFGFQIHAMEGKSVASQAALLARADVLVSPHGGALTNMIFCCPGVHVIELFSRHVYPFYYGLAQLCGHRYHAVLEHMQDYPRLVSFREASRFGASQYQLRTRALDFDVCRDMLERTLASLDT